tara:strand:+ start:1106 stop:2047 length:942 start_codon:yes stop_codon:yes gene_type:complete
MKALAEFVMRGRAQALMIAVAGAVIVLFAWVSAAVVALVTLRKGPAEGVWLLAWALLPAAIIAWRFGDTSAVALLLGTASLALVLRATVSLSLALLASVAVGVAAGILMLSVGEAYLEQVRIELVEPYVAYLEQYASRNGEMVTLPRPGAIAIAGMIGTGTSTLSILSLLLARYWQASLYNPGGFGQEFRTLRYPAAVSLALLVGVLLIFSQGAEWRTWAMIGVAPLMFAGLGLVHARARQKAWSGMLLALFYIAWFLFGAMQMLVVMLAVVDGWWDFRGRWGSVPGDSLAPPKDRRDDTTDQRSDDNDERDQ